MKRSILLICGGGVGQAGGMCSAFLLGSVGLCAGARPYLGARIVSGDEMIDGVSSPRGCGRSVYGGRPAPVGRWRQEHYGSRPQGIGVTMGKRTADH
jgi:hypothetical protein